MSLSDNYTPLRQLGNGVTTAFAPSWKALNAGYLRVYKEVAATGVRTLLTINTDYTVALDSDGFATVTYLVAPTASQYAFIDRDTTQSQEAPYKTAKGFQGEVLESSFDKLTAMVQDTNVRLDAAILAPSGDTGLVLPGAAERADTYLHFDSNGDVELLANALADGTYADIIVSGDGSLMNIAAGAVGDAEVAAGIDAAKLANGSVSNTEFQYLNGVTSAVQTQLDAKQTGDATLTALAAYNTNGIMTQTAADTFTGRTITGTANEVTVTNGDGVSGNPTLSLPAAIDLGGKTSLEIPNSAAPTLNATGQIALDTTVTDFTGGLLKVYSGAEYGAVMMPIASFGSPTNGYVVSYNSTTDAFELVAQTGGGGGTPGGSDTQLQYNNAGSFGGITGATTNGTSVTLTSPTFITPALGTPASGVATNLTGTAASLTAGTATVASTVSTANEASDTTCFPLFVTASGTQSLQPKNNTTWTFNSNTGAMAIPSLTLTTDLAVADGGTGASTFTDAGVLIGNGTGAIQVTSAGTAGHVLTSNGAGVDPTFQASSAAAGITAVSGSPSTPSGVPNVDFTSISGGNDLVVTWSGISCGTATRQLLIKPSIGGVFGGTDVLIQVGYNTNAAPPTQVISFTGAQTNLTQAAANTCSGTLTIYNYAGTTHYKQFRIEGKSATGGSERAYSFEGTFYSASAIDGLRFEWGNGTTETGQGATNFDAGTINVGTRI